MTKLYLSGIEINKNYIEEEAIRNSKYILSSYFYLRKYMKDPFIAKIVQEYNARDCLLLDSGAFSFMNGKDIKVEKLDSYCKEYAQFIKKYNIKRYVELDIDTVFGYKKALEYRAYLEKETGRPCIPIWHKSRGKKEFMKMCEQYEYAGIGGIAIKNISRSEWKNFKYLNQFANSRNCRLHAMGFTPKHDLKEYGFYSCDSTSWTRPIRFGGLDYFDGTRIVSKSFNRRINPKKRKQILTLSWNEWCKYQHYVDN
jgi:hypothetical protein